MIEKINLLQKWIETITTATLGVISGFFINEIIQESSFQIFLLLALIVLIILLEKSFDWLLKSIIIRSATLRKLVAGNHYIEGYWLETMFSTDNLTEPYGYAFIAITFSDAEYLISGKMIDKNLTRCVSIFKSNYSDYKKYSLSYYFDGRNIADNGTDDIIGRGEFTFLPGSKMPMYLSGKIIDTKNQGSLKIEAKKIMDTIDINFEYTDDNELINLIKNHITII